MNKRPITFIAVSAIVLSSCSSSKKSTTSSTATNTNSTTVTAITKPANGIYAPGNEELSAIQVQYQDITIGKLNEGHALYTQGACIKCHGAKNIYKRDETQWKSIIDNMAKKAKITDEQKDAVYKYVLAIKATQPKEAK